MKKVFIAMLAIVIVILSFSLGSWGVENEAVLAGYENTRKYATDAKMLTVAVDTYKNEVDMYIRDEDSRKNFEPSSTIDLGSWNNMLTEEGYEAYTASLYMSSDINMYPDGLSGYSDWSSTHPPAEDRSLAATYDSSTPLHYMTTDDKTCYGATTETELDVYSAIQCAAFGDVYVNQVSYKDEVTDKSKVVIVGSGLGDYQLPGSALFETMGTAWKSDDYGAISYYNNAKGLHDFFTGVTPGTYVRTHGDNNHSYIVLGGDENGLVIYDANACGKEQGCGICCRYFTWEELAKKAWYSDRISLIISPPNTKLPAGCYFETVLKHSHILGKESE